MDLPLLIQVASCRRDGAVREISLLLESRGFTFRVAQSLDGCWEILVEEGDAARARAPRPAPGRAPRRRSFRDIAR